MNGKHVEGAAQRSLLEVSDLVVEYPGGRGKPPFRAVDHVDFLVKPQETLGVVGESGSGKSTIARAVLGLAATTSGTIQFDHEDITHASQRRRRAFSAQLQVVFQDPYSSLNPARSIGQTLGETLRVHERIAADEIRARVETMLDRVGLPAQAADRFPSQFSGGQRQRIAIARALMVQPRLVICDEAVSALDLSIQAQILNLLHDLQAEFELSYLFIAHDLAVVRHASHRIIVMYSGRIVEEGSAATVYDSPRHPYTRTLLDSAPVPDPKVQRERRRPTLVRNPAPPELASACPFVVRCPHATSICSHVRPVLESTPDGSRVACHHWRELETPGRGATVHLGLPTSVS